jgi:hypothetical protein
MLARRMGSVTGGLLFLLAAGPAQASVFCVRPGYPVGCVSHPAFGTPGIPGPGRQPPVAYRPARPPARAHRPATTAGAPGPGVAPANRGGPVNRAGVQ